jgi:RND family efflux transporter MFP subunit
VNDDSHLGLHSATELKNSEGSEKMKRIIVAVLIVLVIIMAGGGLIALKKKKLSAAPVDSSRPIPVQVATVEYGSMEQTRTYLARIEPWQISKVSSRITSPIIEISVEEGDAVTQGETVARLEDEISLLAVEAALAQVERSRDQGAALQATLDAEQTTVLFWEQEAARDALLFEEGAIAQTVADATANRLSDELGRLETAQRSYLAAEKQIQIEGKRLEQARAQLAYAEIKSPFSGVIQKRLVDPGDLATPGKVLLEIEDQQHYKLLFNVPQDDLRFIQTGMSVKSDRYPTLEGMMISRIYPALNQDQTLTVEVEAPGSELLRSGSFVPVEVVLQRFEHVAQLPDNCLLPTPDGKTAVFVVEAGVTRPVLVTTLVSSGGLTAIEGLAAGTQVVQSTFLGWNRLAAGEAVEVIQ